MVYQTDSIMPRYEITAPDGKRFEINAPEGATQEQALKYAKQQFAAPAPASAPAPTPQAQAPGSEPLPPLSQRLGDIGMAGVRGVTSGGGPLGGIMGMTGEGIKQSGELLNRGAYRAGGAVTDVASGMGASPEVAGGAGYLANVGVQAIPTLLGAGAGRAAQPAVTAPFKAAGRVARNVADPWTSGGIDRAVGRTALEAAGPKRQA